MVHVRGGLLMSLTDSLKKEFCFCPLKGRSKEEVLSNLLSSFASAYGMSEEEEKKALDAVMKREALGSTGLEHGVAIPHAKVDFIHKPVVAIAVGENEIDFSSADGKPTKVYFLVLGSDEHPSEHVQVLSQIAQIARNSTLLNMIRNSRNKDELASIFFS